MNGNRLHLFRNCRLATDIYSSNVFLNLNGFIRNTPRTIQGSTNVIFFSCAYITMDDYAVMIVRSHVYNASVPLMQWYTIKVGGLAKWLVRWTRNNSAKRTRRHTEPTTCIIAVFSLYTLVCARASVQQQKTMHSKHTAIRYQKTKFGTPCRRRHNNSELAMRDSGHVTGSALFRLTSSGPWKSKLRQKRFLHSIFLYYIHIS